ncbi:hypothetical protein BURK1_02129 [Burkholderiales bacterium]|nr:hypothetical protein BURK1_02129 [Burkholderiales bacterium]
MSRPCTRHDPRGAPAPLVPESPHACDDCPDAVGHVAPRAFVREAELGIGLVWRLARGGVSMYARTPGVDEVLRRIRECRHPYHDAVAGALDERHRAFGAA